MCAIEDGSVELVETLLKRGANIEACLDVCPPPLPLTFLPNILCDMSYYVILFPLSGWRNGSITDG